MKLKGWENNDNLAMMLTVIVPVQMFIRIFYFYYKFPELISGRRAWMSYTVNPTMISLLIHLNATWIFHWLSPNSLKKFLEKQEMIILIELFISTVLSGVIWYYLRQQYELERAYEIYEYGTICIIFLDCIAMLIVYRIKKVRKSKES